MGRTKATPVKFVAKNATPLQAVRKQPKAVLKSYAVFPSDSTNVENYLGYIWLGISNNVLPQDWKQCKVAFINNESMHLKMKFDSNMIVLIEVSDDNNFIKELFKSKIFAMQFKNEGDQFYAELYIAQLPLPRFNKSISNMIRIVFARIYNIEFCEIGVEELISAAIRVLLICYEKLRSKPMWWNLNEEALS